GMGPSGVQAASNRASYRPVTCFFGLAMAGAFLGCGPSSRSTEPGPEKVLASFRLGGIELRASQVVVPGDGVPPAGSRQPPHLIIINENETLRDVSVGVVTVRYRGHTEAAATHDLDGVWEHGKGKAVEVSAETMEDIRSVRLEGTAVDPSGKRRKILFDNARD